MQVPAHPASLRGGASAIAICDLDIHASASVDRPLRLNVEAIMTEVRPFTNWRMTRCRECDPVACTTPGTLPHYGVETGAGRVWNITPPMP